MDRGSHPRKGRILRLGQVQVQQAGVRVGVGVGRELVVVPIRHPVRPIHLCPVACGVDRIIRPRIVRTVARRGRLALVCKVQVLPF